MMAVLALTGIVLAVFAVLFIGGVLVGVGFTATVEASLEKDRAHQQAKAEMAHQSLNALDGLHGAQK